MYRSQRWKMECDAKAPTSWALFFVEFFNVRISTTEATQSKGCIMGTRKLKKSPFGSHAHKVQKARQMKKQQGHTDRVTVLGNPVSGWLQCSLQATNWLCNNTANKLLRSASGWQIWLRMDRFQHRKGIGSKKER